MKVKNVSEGLTAVRTRQGIITIAPGEVKEIKDGTLLTRLHPSLIIMKEAKEDKIVNRPAEETKVEKENIAVPDEVALKEGEAPDATALKAKLKSLKASWRRTQRVAAKEQIAKEIKELEKQLGQLK